MDFSKCIVFIALNDTGTCQYCLCCNVFTLVSTILFPCPPVSHFSFPSCVLHFLWPHSDTSTFKTGFVRTLKKPSTCSEQFFFSCLDMPSWPKPPQWSPSITLRHTTLGRTPLDEWSACHRDLYLTKHNTHKRDNHDPGGIWIHNPSKHIL